MKGAFQEGPAMEPLFEMYLTVRSVSGRAERQRQASRTLIVNDQQGEQRDNDGPRIHALEHAANETGGDLGAQQLRGDLGIGGWRREAAIGGGHGWAGGAGGEEAAC